MWSADKSLQTLKCIHLHKRALSSSLSQYSAARPASERYRAAAHMGYSHTALAGASNDQAAKAAMSVPEHMGNYSENLTLVTRHDRAWVRPSIQTQTTLFQRRGTVSNIASKCPGPETRAVQPVLKRSDRTSPGERAGERLLQPLFCGAQERWRTLPDSRSQAHQQSALQASVQDDIAGTGPGANSPQETGCVRGFKGRVLSHSDSTASQMLSEVCSRGHSEPVPCSSVWTGFGPAHFLKVHGRSSPPPLRVCVDMCKSILAPSQSITYLGVCFN